MWQHLQDFYARPFKGSADMSAADWFFFVGLLIIIMAGWGFILSHIKGR